MNKEVLYKYFSGKATPEELHSVREWVEASQENKELFFKERKLFDAITIVGEMDKSSKNHKTTPMFRTVGYRFMKYAAFVAAVVSATIFVQYIFKPENRIAMNTISVPAGQRINLTLSDGTSIWLNACSTLKYPAEFKGDDRKVILDGEAYLEVAHDKKKPFIVSTSRCDVEVLGTKFNVEAYSKTDKFETSLMEGGVRVSLKDNPQKYVLLSPNEKASLKDGYFIKGKISDMNVYRWKEGLICYRNQSFTDIMNSFEKYFDLKIVVRNNNALKYRGTGKFRQSDGIDYALKVLQSELPFKYSRNETNDTLLIN